MDSFTLVIANKAYSSWSMRAWLALKLTGAPFAEIVIPLRQAGTAAEIAKYSPSGKLPALRHGGVTVWDSLAILEYLAELFPEAAMWPQDRAARALARSVSAEMHSGFQALRTQMPMNLRAIRPLRSRSPEADRDIDRLTALWRDCRSRSEANGPFLFGPFCNADAVFAPVVTRFQTYSVEMDPICRAYADAILAWPAVREWYAAAAAEPWLIPEYEVA